MDTIRIVALCLGLASAQVISLGLDGAIALPTLTQSCPPILTITVLPPDYTGSFTNLAGLPTLSVPSLSIDTGLLTLLPTALPSVDLSLSLPTVLPSLTLDLPTALPSLTLPFSIPTAIPTNLLPSVTLALPTISIPVSALLPTSLLAGPTPTPVAYTCPEYDSQTIYENGLLYVLSCEAQAAGDIYAAVTANNTFNDCFTACDGTGSLFGALFCTGFSYVPEASGGGTCYLQNSVAQNFVAGGTGRIGAVRLLNYILGGNLVAPILAALPTVSLTTPTDLPTIALPSLPIPTELPLTSILNDLSSQLAGLSTAIPLPTDMNLPLSSVLNGLSTNLEQLSLPTVLPTPNLPSLSVPTLPTLTAISLPGISLPSISIPTPTVDLGAITSVINGLTTIIAIPTMSLPAVSIATPSVNLGGITSVINGLTTVLANPTVSLPNLSLPGLSIPSLSLPAVSIATPTINLGSITSVINGLTTVIAVPTVSIPSISIPAVSIPSISLSAVSIAAPTLSITSIINGLTTVIAVPSISLPSVSLSTPSISLGAVTTLLNGLTTVIVLPTLSVPSVSNPLASLSTASVLLSLPSTNILGGLSTAIVIPTTNNLPGLPGLPTLIPSAISFSAISGVFRSSITSVALLTATSSRSLTSLNVVLPSTILTAVPTATTIPIFSCPRDNGLAYLSPTGLAFIVECGIALVGDDISNSAKPDLQSCVDSCGTVAGCTGVSYSVGLCTYKSAVVTGVPSLVTDSAAPLDLSCPAGNGYTYLDYLGGNYQVLCNTTFPDAAIISSPNIKREVVVRAVVPAVAPVVLCSGRCSSFSGCIGVISSTTGQCTFLSAFGNAGTGSSTIDSIVMVGKRIVAVVSGSAVTLTSRATGVPAYTTRTGSAINNAATTTTTTAKLSLPPVSVSAGLTIGAGAGVGGLPALATSITLTGFATVISTTISRITQVLPVTTILSTSTFISCNQGNNGFITCPVVSVTNTLLATGLIPL